MTRRSTDASTASSGSRSTASRRGKASANTRARPSKRSTRRSAASESPPEAAAATAPAAPEDPPRRRTRAKRGQGDQLREQILDATRDLLIETGNADLVSTRAVARRVGCSSPALYLHFPDRAGLLWEVCNRQFTRLGELIRDAVADHDDPIEALRAAGRAYVTFGVEHAEEYRVMMMGDETVVWDPAIDELPDEAGFDVLFALITRAIDEGAMRPADPIAVSLAVWSTVHGLVAIRLAKPSFPWPPLDDHIDQILDLVTDGLAPRSRSLDVVASPRPAARGRSTAPKAKKRAG